MNLYIREDTICGKDIEIIQYYVIGKCVYNSDLKKKKHFHLKSLAN